MPLFTLADAELAYGDVPLLDRASFAMEAGERIGLIGRNGTGKSSLLRILAGQLAMDDGELKKSEHLRIAYVPQEPALLTSFDVKKHKHEEFLHRLGVNTETDRPPCPAARGSAPRSRSPSRRNPTCCCSMSRRTTSTSMGFSSSKTCS